MKQYVELDWMCRRKRHDRASGRSANAAGLYSQLQAVRRLPRPLAGHGQAAKIGLGSPLVRFWSA